MSSVPLTFVTLLKSQLEALAAAGSALTIITSEGALVESLKTSSIWRYVRADIAREIAPLKDLKAVFQLWRLYRSGQYEIVHSVTPKAGLLTSLAAYFARVPIRIHTFTGQAWATQKGIKRRILWFCDWLIVRLNTQCYTDSPSQKAFLVRAGVGSSSKLAVLGQGSLAGVDVQRFSEASICAEATQAVQTKFQLSPERPVFTFLGRITKDKGVFELLKAARKLFEQGWDFDLLMVGPFEQSIEPEIRELARKIESRRIHFVGYCEAPEFYYSVTDVLCLPSYREGFGSVVIEAAAMETPTIGTNIYGLSDAIIDGQTGLLVEPRSVDDLARAMQRMMEDKAFRIRLGVAAKQRALSQFDSRRLNALLIDEYCLLLEQHRRTP